METLQDKPAGGEAGRKPVVVTRKSYLAIFVVLAMLILGFCGKVSELRTPKGEREDFSESFRAFKEAAMDELGILPDTLAVDGQDSLEVD